MATNQFQSHTGSDGSTPDQRMQQAGYTNASSTGENAFAYATSVDEAMQAFLIDWGVSDDGHRRNILQPGVSANDAYQSVGIGIATTPANSKVGPMVITQDFGSQPSQQAQLVGVAYYDNQQTGMYEIGEGQGGVQINATNLATGQTTSTQTWSSGGYQIALSPGQYQITASFNGTVFQTLPGDDRNRERRARLRAEQYLGRPFAQPGAQFADSQYDDVDSTIHRGSECRDITIHFRTRARPWEYCQLSRVPGPPGRLRFR